MHIFINRDTLHAALDLAAGAINSRSTQPILGNYKLEASGDRLEITAFSYDLCIRIWVAARIEQEGAITLPARLLKEYINTQPPERLEIDVNDRTCSATIISARSTATIKGMDAAEFPLVKAPVGEALTLDRTEFFGMLPQVLCCASDDQSKPTLCGVHTVIKDKRLLMAATDGYRLGVRRMAISDERSGELIIRAAELDKIQKLAVKAEGDLLVYYNNDAIWFDLAGKDEIIKMQACVSRVDARFPDYWAIVPKIMNTRVLVETAVLLKAVKVAYLFARDNANIVRLSCGETEPGKGFVDVLASSTEMGDSAGRVDATLEGAPVTIAFNAKFLINALEQIDRAFVYLEFTQPTRPGVLYPMEVSKSDFMYVLMPMHSEKK